MRKTSKLSSSHKHKLQILVCALHLQTLFVIFPSKLLFSFSSLFFQNFFTCKSLIGCFVSLQGHKYGMSSGDKTEDHSLLGAIMKKDSEAKGAIAVHARRPSLRSDLVDLKGRALVEKQRIKEFESSSAEKLKQVCSLL